MPPQSMYSATQERITQILRPVMACCLSILIVGGKFGIKPLWQRGLPIFHQSKEGWRWIARLGNLPKFNAYMMFC